MCIYENMGLVDKCVGVFLHTPRTDIPMEEADVRVFTPDG